MRVRESNNSHGQTFASRVSTFIQLFSSCSRLTRAWALKKLSSICKLSPVNFHQLLCNFSRLPRTREWIKLSCKLSLVNLYQLSCNSCYRLTRTWEFRKLSHKLSNSLVNSHQLLFSFSCSSCTFRNQFFHQFFFLFFGLHYFVQLRFQVFDFSRFLFQFISDSF